MGRTPVFIVTGLLISTTLAGCHWWLPRRQQQKTPTPAQGHINPQGGQQITGVSQNKHVGTNLHGSQYPGGPVSYKQSPVPYPGNPGQQSQFGQGTPTGFVNQQTNTHLTTPHPQTGIQQTGFNNGYPGANSGITMPPNTIRNGQVNNNMPPPAPVSGQPVIGRSATTPGMVVPQTIPGTTGPAGIGVQQQGLQLPPNQIAPYPPPTR